MQLNVSLDIQDEATPALKRAIAKLSPRELGAKIGQPLEEFWRDRLKGLGTNERGWPSTHFWERASRSVVHNGAPEGVLLTADQQGLRQRWLGGRISPVKAKALAIPISPVSYGKTPAEFKGLFLINTPKGAYLVQNGQKLSGKTGKMMRQEGPGYPGRRQRATLIFLFKLSKGVDQAGNDRVVPTRQEFADVAAKAIKSSIQ